jgi:hypothetical protein
MDSQKRLDDEDNALLRSTAGSLAGLRTEVHTLDAEFKSRPSDVVDAACRVLSTSGRLLSEDGRVLRGSVKSGILNMNQSVVRVEVGAPDTESTHVHIRGIAREGVVSQHTARKACARVLQAMRAQLTS